MANEILGLAVVMAATTSVRTLPVDTCASSADDTFQHIQPKSTLADSVVYLPCSQICPPNVSTDISIEFCHKNCKAYLECRLLREPNGDNVLLWLQRDTNSVAAAGSQPPDTWIYYPVYPARYIPCASLCKKPADDFCSRNCPGYARSMRRMRLTTTISIAENRKTESSISITNLMEYHEGPYVDESASRTTDDAPGRDVPSVSGPTSDESILTASAQPLAVLHLVILVVLLSLGVFVALVVTSLVAIISLRWKPGRTRTKQATPDGGAGPEVQLHVGQVRPNAVDNNEELQLSQRGNEADEQQAGSPADNDDEGASLLVHVQPPPRDVDVGLPLPEANGPCNLLEDPASLPENGGGFDAVPEPDSGRHSTSDLLSTLDPIPHQ